MRYPIYDETKNDYTLVKVKYPTQIEEIGRLRYLAWKDEKGINNSFFLKGYWIDDYDKDSHIWVLVFDNKLVASARLSIHYTVDSIPWNEYFPPEAKCLIETPVASMNRLTVLPEFRKKGLSTLLDNVRINTAKKEKVKSIIAEPIVPRFKTFEKYGFNHYG
ncbi:MAG: GNAT family N-acetyltransferase, partial [Bacteroidetes bacterium]|nr:GNAT family N-acetyltransferase [Bacteroidota bacterium]